MQTMMGGERGKRGEGNFVTGAVTLLLPLCYGCDLNFVPILPMCYGCYGPEGSRGGKGGMPFVLVFACLAEAPSEGGTALRSALMKAGPRFARLYSVLHCQPQTLTNAF